MFVVEVNHKVHEEIETIPLHSLNLLVTIEPLKACSAQCCNLTFPWSQNALEVRMLSKSLPLPKLNTRKRYLCVGDSHVNISVKYTTMPQGRTIAATSAVLSKNLFTFLGFLHPNQQFITVYVWNIYTGTVQRGGGTKLWVWNSNFLGSNLTVKVMMMFTEFWGFLVLFFGDGRVRAALDHVDSFINSYLGLWCCVVATSCIGHAIYLYTTHWFVTFRIFRSGKWNFESSAKM